MPFRNNNYSRPAFGRNNHNNVSSFDTFILGRRQDICDTRGRLTTQERQHLFNYQKLTTGLNFKSDNEIPITVSNAELPKASKFSDIPLNTQIAANISECGYEEMTPVQKAALPLGFEQRDLLTCAQTGSGKTVAFLVPIIQRIIQLNSQTSHTDRMRERQRNYCHYPQALVLTPTRELAKQVYVQAIRLCHQTGVMPGLVYGGISKSTQLRDLGKGGVDILIGTPGRVNDLISSGDITLSKAFGLVLDEGDKMLDMGFHDQITDAITNGNFPINPQDRHNNQKGTINDNRQVFLFSATFPEEIRNLATTFLDSSKAAYITVGVIGATNKDIKQHFVNTPDDHAKTEKMEEIIKQTLEQDENGKVLVFVNRKRTADDLERAIRDKRTARVSAIHGDKSQDARDRVLGNFKSNSIRVLVATDVAARGLDIPSVSAVINYDLAPTTDDHVHRIGRTGRAGNTGNAYTFISNNENKNLFDLVKMLEKEKVQMPEFMKSLGYASRNKSSRFGGRGFGRSRGGGGFGRGGGYRNNGGGFGGRKFGGNGGGYGYSNNSGRW